MKNSKPRIFNILCTIKSEKVLIHFSIN